MPKPTATPKTRNPVHVKSKTGRRVKSRLSVEDAIDEWYETTE